MNQKIMLICAVAFLFCLASVWYNEKKKDDRASTITLLIAYVLLFVAVGMQIERIAGGF